MLRILATGCVLAVATIAATSGARTSTSFVDPAKKVEASTSVRLALNPQPEPPNKNKKPQKIKKGDPGKNK